MYSLPSTEHADNVHQDHGSHTPRDGEGDKGQEDEADADVGERQGRHGDARVDGAGRAEAGQDGLVRGQGLCRAQPRGRLQGTQQPGQADNVGPQVRAERRREARSDEEGDKVQRRVGRVELVVLAILAPDEVLVRRGAKGVEGNRVKCEVGEFLVRKL